jgi:hypothetical protein
MIQLNANESELLFEVSECHLKFLKLYDDSNTINFSEILEMNHNKLDVIAKATNQPLSEILNKMKNNYIEYINEYSD